MRGYAPTEAPKDGRYQTSLLSRDVLALIGALGAERAYLVGNDWGASAVSGAAILEPEKVAKLVTIASGRADENLPHDRHHFARALSDLVRIDWYFTPTQQALSRLLNEFGQLCALPVAVTLALGEEHQARRVGAFSGEFEAELGGFLTQEAIRQLDQHPRTVTGIGVAATSASVLEANQDV